MAAEGVLDLYPTKTAWVGVLDLFSDVDPLLQRHLANPLVRLREAVTEGKPCILLVSKGMMPALEGGALNLSKSTRATLAEMRRSCQVATYDGTIQDLEDSLAEALRPLPDSSLGVPRAKPGRPQVFLSHSGSQELTIQVVAILDAVFNGKATIWHDQEIGGGKWRPQIAVNLDKSSALVVIATLGVLRSTFVGYEVGYADKDLGAAGIFVLKVGPTSDEVSRSRPLDEFQHFDATEPVNLRKFAERLGRKLGLDLNATETRWKDWATRCSELAAQDAKQSRPDQVQVVDRFLEAIDAAFALAYRHTLQEYGQHIEAENQPFDVDEIKGLRTTLFSTLSPQCREVTLRLIGRLQEANATLQAAVAEDIPGKAPGPKRWRMIAGARHLRDPLVETDANLRHFYGRAVRPQPFPKF